MAIVVALVSGLLFGLGLMISGLMNPAKVLNFLDVAGTWDPSLAFTMGAAIPVAAIGFRLACRAETPLYGCACEPPDKDGIDATLLSGAAIFGIGWGLVGFCPGPALAALSTGSSSAILFTATMLAGMALARAQAEQTTAGPTPMTTRRLTNDLSVAPQISVSDVAGLAAEGFKSLICNRPDGESPDQPAFAEIERAARAAGLPTRNIPIVPGRMTPADVAAFKAALAELPKPILAYCRTGTRCTTLWSLSQAGERPAEEILSTAAAAGYDMSPIAGALKQR